MASPHGVLLVDPNGTICFANPGLTAMLGWCGDELLGRPVEVLVPERFRQHHHQDRQSFLRNPQARQIQPGGELHARGRNDTEVPVELNLVPVATDEGTYTMATLVDLRDKREHEARATSAGHLASLGALAAGVAHEVNNPTASVTANLEALRLRLDELALRLPSADLEIDHILEEAREAIAESLASAERVTAVVSQLKVLTGARYEHDPRTLCLNELVRWTCLVVQGEILERAQLELELEDGLPMLKGDAFGLNQVVTNLLENAWQATPANATDSHSVRVRTRLKGANVLLEVEDDGVGLTWQDAEKAFERFYSTKSMAAGAGLGLPHAREVVEAQGGTITLEPRREGGARAVVTLPVPTQARFTAMSPPPSSTQRTARVLVIDDDDNVRRAYRRVLRPHEVVSADGVGAWARFERGDHDFDMVLCDVTMPVLDGTTLFARVHERWPDLAERFVFNTGGAISSQARRLLEAHRQPVLYKPVSREELLAALAKQGLMGSRGASRSRHFSRA